MIKGEPMTGENAPANNVNSTGFENMANEKPRVNHNNLKRLAAGFAAAAAIFNAGCGSDTKGYKKETAKGSMAGSSTEITEHTDIDTSSPFTETSETELTTSDTTDTTPSETSIELSSSFSPTETETPIQKEAKVISATPSYGYGNYPIYKVEDVVIEPGLDYKDYLLEETPSDAPESPYGCLDFTKYCQDLGVDPSTIKSAGSGRIILNDSVLIEENNIRFQSGGETLCRYNSGKESGLALDGISLYYYDEEAGKYVFATRMHYNENNMGALELAVKASTTGDTNPYD